MSGGLGLAAPSGTLGITVLKRGAYTLTYEDVVDGIRNLANKKLVLKEYRKIAIAKKLGIPTFYGSLFIKTFDPLGNLKEDHGLVSLRVVTDTGVAYIVDAFQNLTELENMKYHGIGTGVTAEAASQSALVTELTTELNPNSTRATGTTTESAANVYQTVGVNTVDAAVALREHGVFSQAAVPGGVMIDRSLFAAVNLESGDSIQTDYRLTFASGG